VDSSNLIEGWRAVLLVILRYRLSQRHWENLLNGAVRRIDSQWSLSQDQTIAAPLEFDPVEAMVAGVKKKGVSFSLLPFLVRPVAWSDAFSRVGSFLPMSKVCWVRWEYALSLDLGIHFLPSVTSSSIRPPPSAACEKRSPRIAAHYEYTTCAWTDPGAWCLRGWDSLALSNICLSMS